MGIDPQDAADPSAHPGQRAIPGPVPSPARAPSRSLRRVVVLLAVAAVLVVLVAVAVTVPFAKGSSASGAHLQPTPHRSATPPSRSSAAPASAPIAHDGGSREYAKGDAVQVGNGVFRYTVASGDTFLGIASRFHVCIADIDSGRPRPDWGSPLTAGTPISVRLGTWPTRADGSVDCIWDH